MSRSRSRSRGRDALQEFLNVQSERAIKTLNGFLDSLVSNISEQLEQLTYFSLEHEIESKLQLKADKLFKGPAKRAQLLRFVQFLGTMDSFSPYDPLLVARETFGAPDLVTTEIGQRLLAETAPDAATRASFVALLDLLLEKHNEVGAFRFDFNALLQEAKASLFGSWVLHAFAQTIREKDFVSNRSNMAWPRNMDIVVATSALHQFSVRLLRIIGFHGFTMSREGSSQTITFRNQMKSTMPVIRIYGISGSMSDLPNALRNARFCDLNLDLLCFDGVALSAPEFFWRDLQTSQVRWQPLERNDRSFDQWLGLASRVMRMEAPSGIWGGNIRFRDPPDELDHLMVSIFRSFEKNGIANVLPNMVEWNALVIANASTTALNALLLDLSDVPEGTMSYKKIVFPTVRLRDLYVRSVPAKIMIREGLSLWRFPQHLPSPTWQYYTTIKPRWPTDSLDDTQLPYGMYPPIDLRSLFLTIPTNNGRTTERDRYLRKQINLLKTPDECLNLALFTDVNIGEQLQEKDENNVVFLTPQEESPSKGDGGQHQSVYRAACFDINMLAKTNRRRYYECFEEDPWLVNETESVAKDILYRRLDVDAHRGASSGAIGTGKPWYVTEDNFREILYAAQHGERLFYVFELPYKLSFTISKGGVEGKDVTSDAHCTAHTAQRVYLIIPAKDLGPHEEYVPPDENEEEENEEASAEEASVEEKEGREEKVADEGGVEEENPFLPDISAFSPVREPANASSSATSPWRTPRSDNRGRFSSPQSAARRFFANEIDDLQESARNLSAELVEAEQEEETEEQENQDPNTTPTHSRFRSRRQR